jgi:hypothetical protein
VVGKPNIGDESKPWFSSLWWKDICSIGTNLDTNWLLRGVTKKLDNGLHTNFWSDIWVGDIPLMDRFPRLFSISNQQEESVAGVRKYLNGSSSWDLSWRRRFFVWEHDLYKELLDLINPVTLVDDMDSWGWMPEGGAGLDRGYQDFFMEMVD